MNPFAATVPEGMAMGVAPEIAFTTIAWAAVAAAWDLRTRKIPNWLTISAALLGLAVNGFIGGIPGLGRSALGIGAGIGLLFIPFAVGGMGAGDVKMLGAIGAFGGPVFVFRAFVYGALAGGVIGLAMMISRARRVGGDRLNALRFGGKAMFPYGIAILAGTVAAVFLM